MNGAYYNTVEIVGCLYNYDNAVRTALERGVALIQDISDQDSHFKLGDMDIQLYNYKIVWS